MHFNGLPSTWNRTSFGSNPISDGISGRSLFEISSVFRFLQTRIDLSMSVSLLLLRTSAERFGAFANCVNEVNRLCES